MVVCMSRESRRVVVSGLGVVSAIGCDTKTFWQNAQDGVCGIDFITSFDTTDFKVKIAAEVKDFDVSAYMDRSESRRTDAFVQYAVAAAQQAVDDSAITGTVDSKRLGTYVGSGIGGMQTTLAEHTKLEKNGPRRVSPYFIPMIISNMAGGTIAIKHKAQGPNLPVVTACATSSHAIGEAFRAVKHGYIDAAIAGGCEASTIPLAIAGFTNIQALSLSEDPKCASIPFDARRDGFVMGEGAAILILEEYEHAIARGAQIYGEIVGYGNTCDAYHTTAPSPDGECAADAITLALEEANLSLRELAHKELYINAHGTSTPLNDKTETASIKRALGGAIAQRAYVSSTKSMTGHMLGAAGAIEATASLLALRDGVVPPTVGYEVFDPECDLNIVATRKKQVALDVALSTSLGFGGHNACLAFAKHA